MGGSDPAAANREPAGRLFVRTRWMSALLALALVACGGGDQKAPVSAFSGRVQDWTAEILRDSPELAARAGVSEAIAGSYRDRLSDRSIAADELRRTAALRRLVEIRGFDRAALSPAEARTYSILASQFADAAAVADFRYGDFHPLDGARPYVLDQQESAFIELPDFLDVRHPIANLADAEAYLRRLQATAVAIDAETARARRDAGDGTVPPDFIIDRTLALLDQGIAAPVGARVYLTSLRRKLDALWPAPAEGQPLSADRRRANALYQRAEQIVGGRIVPAEQRAAAYLRSLRAQASHDAGVWRLPDGAAYYAALLRFNTTTALTPDQIHAIGLNRVRSLNADADIALRRIGLTEGSVGQRLAQLTADPRYAYPDTDEGRAQLIADARARIDAIMSRANQWFGRLPRAKLDVRRVPRAAEAASAGAYYEAPSLDGSQPGVYYINLRSLSEMTRIDLPTQDFHEGAPGHHFQTALAQEQTELPLLRRLMSFPAYSEGWALYAEQLADENGLYENDHIGRIGYLRWQLWRAARLVVDTGLHAKRWSREQAIEYLAATTGDALPVIVTEVERYAASPGQACAYELGRREIARLRDEARRARGTAFELRAFHDVVLLSGEVPLPVLDEIVTGWVAQRTGR
ncbi:MAG: DUF885 domain-containing protein [Hyphomonadaceae bacterium]|nr:DUF885 domain-containing protein [Hyphomonadaceae bacterium]